MLVFNDAGVRSGAATVRDFRTCGCFRLFDFGQSSLPVIHVLYSKK